MWIDWVVAIWNIWSTIGEIVMMVGAKGGGGRLRVRVQVKNKYLFGTFGGCHIAASYRSQSQSDQCTVGVTT